MLKMLTKIVGSISLLTLVTLNGTSASDHRGRISIINKSAAKTIFACRAYDAQKNELSAQFARNNELVTWDVDIELCSQSAPCAIECRLKDDKIKKLITNPKETAFQIEDIPGNEGMRRIVTEKQGPHS